MDFDEFFRKKKIDLAALGKAEPALLAEFRTHYEQMGEKSFDHTKKYWFNKLRLIYHLAPEIKEEKVPIANPLAEQTITETLSETIAPPAKVGFKPRFNAGLAKPAELNEETPVPEPEKPVENSDTATSPAPTVGFKPRFKAGVTKPAETPAPEPEKPVENSETPASPAPAVGFKPRFKAGVTKPVTEEKEEPKAEPPVEEKPAEDTAPKPTIGFKPRFNAKQNPSKDS